MHKIKNIFWLSSVLILWTIHMRSLARVCTLFQTPWSLALPHWRFSPTASPGAVLTTLGRCPLNVDLHWRFPDQIKFARVLVPTFLRLYQTFGNLNQDLCPHKAEATESENKKGIEPLPHLETLPRIRFGLQLPVKGQNSSHGFFPALGSCTPRIKSRVRLVMHIEETST